jgi:hypothetical protein
MLGHLSIHLQISIWPHRILKVNNYLLPNRNYKAWSNIFHYSFTSNANTAGTIQLPQTLTLLLHLVEGDVWLQDVQQMPEMLHRGHFHFHAIVHSEIHLAIGSNGRSQTYLQHLSYLSSSVLHVLLDLQAEHWIYNTSLLNW